MSSLLQQSQSPFKERKKYDFIPFTPPPPHPKNHHADNYEISGLDPDGLLRSDVNNIFLYINEEGEEEQVDEAAMNP